MSRLSLDRLIVLPLFLAGALSGCGAPEGLGGEPTDETGAVGSVASALTGYSAGPYGTTSGTHVGTGSNQLTPVTRIDAWADQTFVYAVKLYWGTQSKMYGDNSHGTLTTLDLTDDYVKRVQYYVDGGSGFLKGLKYTPRFGGAMTIGAVPSLATAFNGTNHKLTDMEGWYGSVSSINVLWGTKIYYTTP